jgi:GNAT superfamily N-acetyltransferase
VVVTADSPVGVHYLDAVTRLLQRRRLAHATNGVWEAADLQWWWPRHHHGEPGDARVWYDDEDEPIAATVFTAWLPERIGCDVLADADFRPAWAFAAERCARMNVPRIEMALPNDDAAVHAVALRTGFAPSEETYTVSWLAPGDRRQPRRPMPEGYRIVARGDDRTRPHPMIGRNGALVEEGLLACSLYDPGLDLVILDRNDTAAAYALFWPDPVTGVGLVEPMRVEDAHAGQGLAAQLLDAGLRGLTARGCTRFKVSFEPANTAAARLYTGAGFVPSRIDRTWLYTRAPVG